jgi:hypothetical protein
MWGTYFQKARAVTALLLKKYRGRQTGIIKVIVGDKFSSGDKQGEHW